MAKLYLDANESFTVAGNSIVTVVGQNGTGTEKVIVNGNTASVTAESSVERIEFTGSSGSYTYAVSGNQLTVKSGATTVATITIPEGTTGQTLAFSDGSAALKLTGFSTATLGGAAVTATAATPSGISVNGNDKSTASTDSNPTTPTFSVAASASSVSEGADASFTVSLAGRAAGTNYGVTLALAATGGATAGTDFTNALTLDAASTAAGITLVSNVLTIPSTSSVATVTLKTAVASDAVTETGEGLSLTLSNATGTSATIGTSTAAVSITDVPLTYTLTGAAATASEGSAIVYTLTASANVLTDTSVAFSVVPGDSAAANQGASNTNLNDFSAGSFNPVTATILAGTKTASFTVTPATDTITELPEAYSVKATVGTTDYTVTTSLLDGASTTPGGTGTTYILTTGVDSGTSFTGGAGNDTFSSGIVDFQTQANSTLKNVDVLDGGSGTDILNILTQGTTQVTDALNAATITSIETINVRTLSTGGAVTIVAGTGVTSINQDRGTTALVVTGLADGAQAGIIGNASTAGDDLTFGYKAGVTSGTLNVKDGVLNTTAAIIVDTDVGVLTSLTVNSTGAANALTSLTLQDVTASVTGLTINAATSLSTGNITGFTGTAATITATGAATNVAATSTAAATGAVNLGTIENTTVKTITASGLTAGGISATLNSNATLVVTGGVGDDYIATGAALTTGSVAAGSGTDTLEITAGGTHLASASLGAKYTGFEVLRLNDTQDVSLVSGITALELKAMTSKTISNITATQAAAIKVSGTQTTGVVLTLTDATGSADAVTLNLKSDTAATNVDVAGLSIIGVETLNIQANSGTSSSADTTATDSNVDFVASGADKLTTINVSGTNDVNLVGTNLSKAVTVNNTQTAGIFTTSGNYIIGSTINGSATLVNSFTAGTAEGIKYVGGSGKDSFSITQAVLLANGTTDTTLTGGSGTDTLTVSDVAAVLTDAHFTNATGMEALTLVGTTSVSLTTGGSFKTAFADGVTITSGTVPMGVATYSMGLYDKAINLTLGTSGAGATLAETLSVDGGSANDTLTITSSFVGHATTDQTISINGGAGDDTISLTMGATLLANAGASTQKIIGGTGADSITVSAHVNDAAATSGVTFVVAVGDSTTTAYDTITGFRIGDHQAGTNSKASDTLDFATVAVNAYTTTAATGFTAAELAVTVAATGVVTFSGTSAATATLAQKIAAVQSVVITTAGDTALFTSGSDTYVFNNNASGDSVVKLVGVTGLALLTAFDVTTNDHIFIA